MLTFLAELWAQRVCLVIGHTPIWDYHRSTTFRQARFRCTRCLRIREVRL